MHGSDRAASLEVEGFKLMVNYVRTVEKAMGTGEKVILDEEREIRKSRSIKFIVIIDKHIAFIPARLGRKA